MKKLILFIGMFVMLLSLSARPIVLSPISDSDDLSPPEITANTNQFQFDPVLATEIYFVPAPPSPIIALGHNNKMTETAPPMAAATVRSYKPFLGPGDSFLSSGPTGQKRLGHDYGIATNPYKGLKRFIGPGDYLLSDKLIGQQHQKELIPGTHKYFMGPGDRVVLGNPAELAMNLNHNGNQAGALRLNVKVNKKPIPLNFLSPGDYDRLTVGISGCQAT